MLKIKTALVLCAGFGKRLKPLTNKTPKPLLKIKNITLLENTLNLLHKLNIKNVLINTFYLKNQIKDFIYKKNFELNIKIIEENEIILDTGGGILNMISKTEDEDFITLNPDTFWSDDHVKEINEMEKYYFSNSIKNILLVVNKKKSFDNRHKGDFNLKDNHLVRSTSCELIYTGCQLLNKNIFKGIHKKIFSLNDIWDRLEKNKKLFGFESKVQFNHITDIEIYNKFSKNN